MHSEIELAKSLREKTSKQLEKLDELIISLSIKSLIPNIFDNGKTKISIDILTKKSHDILTKKNIYLLDKRRNLFIVKINEQLFPADNIPDELWDHVVKTNKKQTLNNYENAN